MTVPSRFRFFVLALTVAAVALLASTASAYPPGLAPEPAPNWLTGGRAPAPDPLQSFLDDKISAFTRPGGGYDVATAYLQKHSGEPSFKNGDCFSSLQAYHSAIDRQKQLGLAFDALQTAFQALNQNQRSFVGLAASRTALLTAQVVAFSGAYGVLTAAATTSVAAGTVISTVNYLAGEIGILRSAYYDNSPPDRVDQQLNSMTLVLGNLAAFKEHHPMPEKALNALAVIASAAKAIHDIYGDYNKFKETEDIATKSYLQAGAHYSTLLNELQKSVTQMKLQDCPPKTPETKPPAGLGPPPPDCGAVNRDYADPTCTTQTRNGTFHFGSHIVHPGGTLTGTVTNRCQKHSTGDFSQPPDQACPIDWSPMLTIGTKVSGCAQENASCTVRVAKTARSTKYIIVTIGITSDQGTGISKDYYAVTATK